MSDHSDRWFETDITEQGSLVAGGLAAENASTWAERAIAIRVEYDQRTAELDAQAQAGTAIRR
jgi:hypothetical protein